ncbi:hypothetical protein FHX52_4076 [Humibacillus xanthopallidus]|uniref:Uncharacterized protein n=1 Tax=Humibacillus xanthopallidus TaxID=412689 RepID=A0A543PL96_9MICO|nr:hypothetical protein [Humibacillus xanthopallidus]TQN44855.1 hypothetical protein FHX52_4076 [Humibacillus xanthopallidus]
MHPTVAGGLVVVLVVVALSLWVLQDARRRRERDRPVVATLAGITIERPEMWAALCLLVFVFFVPLYLVARNAD